MRRGFAFTLAAVALALVLLALALAAQRGERASLDAAEAVLLSRKLAYAVDDIAEDVEIATDLRVEQSDEVLAIFDSLPSTDNITALLRGYDRFVKEYYSTPETRFAFLSSTGQEVNLTSLTARLQVLPWGFNYTYPDYGKNELFFRADPSNFSQIRLVYLNITLTDAWFNQNVSDASCSAWNPYANCTGGTTHCLNFRLVVRDTNGSTYASACTSFDADRNSNIQLNLANETNPNKWIKVFLGILPDLYNVKLQNTAIDIQNAFVFNSSAYYMAFPNQVRAADLPSNQSLTAPLTPAGEEANVTDVGLLRQLAG